MRGNEKIAEERKIPIDDPIFSFTDPVVIEKYLASDVLDRMSSEVVIGHLAVFLANARGTDDLDEVARFFDVANSQELLVNIGLAAADRKKDPKSYDIRSKRMFDDLINISNIVSAQVLDYYLRQSSGRKNVAVYLGKAHEEIVRMDLSQIPENMRLSDNKIRDLLQARIRARLERTLRLSGVKDNLRGRRYDSLPKCTEPDPRIDSRESSTKNDRLAEKLDEISSLPKDIRSIIEEWSGNLFGLGYVRKRGYKEYLNSDSSLHQIWGAAVMLQIMVESAKSKNRDLTFIEISMVRNAFLKAANTRRKDCSIRQADQIEKLSRNIKFLAEIIKKLKYE